MAIIPAQRSALLFGVISAGVMGVLYWVRKRTSQA